MTKNSALPGNRRVKSYEPTKSGERAKLATFIGGQQVSQPWVDPVAAILEENR